MIFRTRKNVFQGPFSISQTWKFIFQPRKIIFQISPEVFRVPFFIFRTRKMIFQTSFWGKNCRVDRQFLPTAAGELRNNPENPPFLSSHPANPAGAALGTRQATLSVSAPLIV